MPGNESRSTEDMHDADDHELIHVFLTDQRPSPSNPKNSNELEKPAKSEKDEKKPSSGPVNQ